MGDELGLLNDPAWAEEPEHAGDNRWVHRPRMPWPLPPDQHGIQAGVRHLVAARASLPHLHAAVPADVLDPRDPGVLLVARRHPVGPMLAAYNVTSSPRHVPLSVLHDLGLDESTVVDHVAGSAPTLWHGAIQLAPYQAVWLTA
jgi:amylosucrase